MNEEKKNQCIGITGICTAILMAMKVAGSIDSSWIIVFAPYVIGIAIKVLASSLEHTYYKARFWKIRRG